MSVVSFMLKELGNKNEEVRYICIYELRVFKKKTLLPKARGNVEKLKLVQYYTLSYLFSPFIELLIVIIIPSIIFC